MTPDLGQLAIPLRQVGRAPCLRGPIGNVLPQCQGEVTKEPEDPFGRCGALCRARVLGRPATGGEQVHDGHPCLSTGAGRNPPHRMIAVPPCSHAVNVFQRMLTVR